MGVSLKWQGLDAFQLALRNAPDSVKSEADFIVRNIASTVSREVRLSYPTGPTGNLQRGVTVEHNSSKWGATGIVRSRARHASIFEVGTKRRQTGNGSNRGAMPKPPAEQRAIPKFIRARQNMRDALIEVLQRAGFEVEA